MPNYKARHDLSGQVFSRLTVTEKFEIRGRRRVYWLCRCDCGAQRWVIADALKSGCTKSCGCLNDETRRLVRHGCGRPGKQSPEYSAWHSMKQRCLNPNSDRFNDYGGRGIKVCQRWADDFAAFLEDMGRRPSGTSIDRIDNDGDYRPGNCRWATSHTQSRNTSRTRWITFSGRTLCLEDWCATLNIKRSTLNTRIARWPLERAMTEPVSQRSPSSSSQLRRP